MMSQEIYEALSSNLPDADKRRLLREFVMEQVAKQRADPAVSEQLAYEITGLLSTPFAASLPEDDPDLRILDLAASLELPEHHRTPEETWATLQNTLGSLPEEER